jgi:cell division protein FtsQ
MKISKRKIKRFFFVLAILVSPVLVGGILFYVNKAEQQVSCVEIKVNFLRRGEGELIKESEVLDLVSKYCNSSSGQANGLQVSVLENKLEMLPAVKNAEVYRKINGELFVEVEQRIPVCRIFDQSGSDYYLDVSGEIFPSVPGISVRVPVVNGFLHEPYNKRRSVMTSDSLKRVSRLDDLHSLFSAIRRDAFRTALVEQVWVSETGEFELIPKIDDHVILFGDTAQMDGKFNKLKIFYEEGLNTFGWNNYRTIDLRYNHQIICKK